MLEEIKNIKIKEKDLWKFGIFIGFISLLIAGLLFWGNNNLFKIFFAISITFLLAVIIKPTFLKSIYWVYMIIAIIIGFIMTRLILSLLFYSIFLVIGLIARLFGKQFIELSWDRSNETYWNNRTNEPPQKENYERQF